MDRETMAGNARSTDDLFPDSEVWRGTTKDAEVGDDLLGEIVGCRVVRSKHGPLAALDVSDTDGVMWTVWVTADIRTQLHAHEARKGDSVYLRFEGYTDLENGNTVKRYSAAFSRGGQILEGEQGRTSKMVPELDDPGPSDADAVPPPEDVPY